MTSEDPHRRAVSSTPRLTPEEIANRGFASAFRGVSETEVRNFLRRVSDEYGFARERERELLARVAGLEEQLKTPPRLTEQQLLDALGEETARVLRSAQDAAQDIRARAEERSGILLREAQEESRSLREQADEHASRRTAAAESAAAERERESLERADAMRAEAERAAAAAAERAEADATTELEQAKESGRVLVEEARAVRERVLADLARRRALLSAQLDELRAGRERLLEAYRVVKETLADATAALAAVQTQAHSEGGVAVDPVPEMDIDIAIDEVEGAAASSAVSSSSSSSSSSSGGQAESSSSTVEPARGAAPGAPATAIAAEPSERGKEEAETPSSAGVVDQLFARLKSGRGESQPATPQASADDGPQVVVAHSPDPDPPPTASPESGPDTTRRAERDDTLGRVQGGLGRQAKRALQDEQNELLDALRTQRGRPRADAVLPPLDRVAETWADVLAPAVDEMYVGAARATVPDTEINAAPRGLVLELAHVVVASPRERLVQVIDASGGDAGADADADADADDAGDVAQRVGARYREWRNQGLDGALTDALVTAWARGTLDAAPAGASLRWVLPEGGCCPDCDDDALEPTRRGEPFPTGQVGPPAHPGCRCLLAVEGSEAAPSRAGAATGSA